MGTRDALGTLAAGMDGQSLQGVSLDDWLQLFFHLCVILIEVQIAMTGTLFGLWITWTLLNQGTSDTRKDHPQDCMHWGGVILQRHQRCLPEEGECAW